MRTRQSGRTRRTDVLVAARRRLVEGTAATASACQRQQSSTVVDPEAARCRGRHPRPVTHRVIAHDETIEPQVFPDARSTRSGRVRAAAGCSRRVWRLRRDGGREPYRRPRRRGGRALGVSAGERREDRRSAPAAVRPDRRCARAQVARGTCSALVPKAIASCGLGWHAARLCRRRDGAVRIASACHAEAIHASVREPWRRSASLARPGARAEQGW